MVTSLLDVMSYKKLKSKNKFPFIKVVYSDSNLYENVDKMTLYSKKYHLKGKPDFVYKTLFNNYIPVEIKSSSIKDSPSPRENEAMQLITYFFLISETYGKPKYGYLIYKDYMFKIKNNRKTRKYFINELKNLREMLETGSNYCEPSFSKCKHCICKNTVCEFC